MFLIKFFSSFTTLILSENYVTKRQSLKLLGEILLDRANFNVMTRYISNEANLKMMMNLLRDKSKNIQFEAFHVFKVSLLVPIKMTNHLRFPRFLLQTQKNHYRLRTFFEGTRINSCHFCKIFIMTKKVSFGDINLTQTHSLFL